MGHPIVKMTRARPPSSWFWTLELLSGVIRRRLSPKPDVIQGKDTKDYFVELSAPEYRKHHAAAGDSLLGKYLKCSVALAGCLRENDIIIYDLGSGYGDFYSTIALPCNSHVVLVDFIPQVLELTRDELSSCVSSVNCLHADLRTWKAPSNVANLAVCINVLPYIPDLDSFFESAQTLLKQDGHLCLVYPLRSVVWEEVFAGIEIIFHNPAHVAQSAERAGFNALEKQEIRFAVPGTWGLCSFPIARLEIFSR